MLPKQKIVECRFDPATFEKISGLDRTMQRNWRRRGLLPPSTTTVSTFNAEDAAIVRLMAGRPSGVQQIAEEAATHVLWSALTFANTWSVEGPLELASEYRKRLELLGHEHIDQMAGIKKRALKRFCVIPEHNRPFLIENADAAFDVMKENRGLFIDLHKIGAEMAAACGTTQLKRIQLPSHFKHTSDLNR